ncbi:MAG: bifunctional methylenetetrahydrofolate dehydrogenase/methenyltetrahydrofolate cyclohydrolase FolD [Campylobacteraceae bacterium]|nr:bifunctional methylenetetrahydrofolate dehydrogenase/methenyltetrahydrofolate cyclohydrolase FolD [Campylobacteraceae bacterium]
MTLLDGKKLSNTIKEDLTKQCKALKEKGIVPGLAVVLVGNDPASATYVKMKEKACEAVGIYSLMHRLDENATQNDLLTLIEELNANPKIDGILVQLPLPKQFDTNAILETISSEKDVDGFHPYNVGRLVQGLSGFKPCTPYGVMKLLEAYNINPSGMNTCIIGRSNIVGKPMANLLLHAGATISICHSKTKNIQEFTSSADLIVVGVGQPALLKAGMIKEGAIVVDVGINRTKEGTLVGDVDFENVAPKCSFITPVPGGVGPMTIAMLLSNCVESASK